MPNRQKETGTEQELHSFALDLAKFTTLDYALQERQIRKLHDELHDNDILAPPPRRKRTAAIHPEQDPI